MIQPGEVTGARNATEAAAFGRRLFDLVNEERRKLGLQPVVRDDNLERIAKQSDRPLRRSAGLLRGAHDLGAIGEHRPIDVYGELLRARLAGRALFDRP